MLDLSKYPFLAIHPGSTESETTPIHITDCATADDFAGRWVEIPGEKGKKVQAEFGYDLPAHTDEHEDIIEDFSTKAARGRMKLATQVLSMTFDQYVELVWQHTQQ